MSSLYQSDFPNLHLLNRGKVRDIYDLGDKLLIITSDRLSAFDVILSDPIPDKGAVLTSLSAHWFRQTEKIVKNHIISFDPSEYPESVQEYASELKGRSMLVKKAKPLPVECIVRGYIAGSGWKEYKDSRSVCGIPLAPGLRESEKLPEPIFTPSTKAELGEHDENIPFEKAVELLGKETAERVKKLALEIYKFGAEEAAAKGILIADTKMEFGMLDGELILIDELLTPDSSRFWKKSDYAVGRSQDSLDKQYVRDYLLTLDWDKTAPGPRLPEEVIAETSRRYREITKILL